MNRHRLSSRDLELEQLAERFAQWRQCRSTPKERIPASLWDQATVLCQTRPPSRVAKYLGLCTSDLKKRCRAHEPCASLPVGTEPSVHFVEVKPASWPPSCGLQIDIQRPDGTRLHLASQEASVPLVELVRAMLEVS